MAFSEATGRKLGDLHVIAMRLVDLYALSP